MKKHLIKSQIEFLKKYKMDKSRLNLDSRKNNQLGKKIINIFKKSKLPTTTEVYGTYWKFAAERQTIFFRRIENKIPPWTTDPILNIYKFTNAYRASDRVSQYLIRDVIYKGDFTAKDILFRLLLFKIFNKIETWELLENEIGELTYANYSFKRYEKVLTSASEEGKTIYSGAYITASGKNAFGYTRKHKNHLKLMELIFQDELPKKIQQLDSLQDLYKLLITYPTIGKFLAYQYAIDINYSTLTSFSEMDFIVPGPGAIDGIKKCFSDPGDLNEADIIRWVTDRQNIEFERRGINFLDLWGRPLQLVDCQNLFCEVDKYARIAHPNFKGVSNRKRIKQKYKLTSKSISYWYPPKWKINSRIEEYYK